MTPRLPKTLRTPAASLWELVGLGDPDASKWIADALCAQADPEAFFPERGESTRAATAICMACPARTDCLTVALERGEAHGIWGGTTPRQRRALHRQRTSDTQMGAVA